MERGRRLYNAFLKWYDVNLFKPFSRGNAEGAVSQI